MSKLEDKELATKGNIKESELRLQKEIVDSKNQTLIWIFSMLIIFSGAIISIIAKGFHWF